MRQTPAVQQKKNTHTILHGRLRFDNEFVIFCALFVVVAVVVFAASGMPFVFCAVKGLFHIDILSSFSVSNVYGGGEGRTRATAVDAITVAQMDAD